MKVAKLGYPLGMASGVNGCLEANEGVGRAGLQFFRASSSMNRWHMVVQHFVFQVTRPRLMKTEGRHSVFSQNA